jgi:hypothetical protein
MWNSAKYSTSKYMASLLRISQYKYSVPEISCDRVTFCEFLELGPYNVWSPEVTVFFYSAVLFPLRSNASNTEQVNDSLYVISSSLIEVAQHQAVCSVSTVGSEVGTQILLEK